MKFMILVKSTPDLEAHLAAMSNSQIKSLMAAMGWPCSTHNQS